MGHFITGVLTEILTPFREDGSIDYKQVEEYKTGTMVETIVCLKNTEVIGAFMAEHLADTGRISMSAGNNISVVTPEFDTMGQILFRDSNQRMIEGKQVLILTDSVTTGALLAKAVEAVLYYGGRVCGMSWIVDCNAVFNLVALERSGYP